MSQLQLGSKVKSNGLMGPKIFGKIVRVQIGYIYYASTAGVSFETWYKHSKNWLHEPVYTVEKQLPDIPFYMDDPDISQECKEYAEATISKTGRRYTDYLPAELEELPDDYDWTEEVEAAL